MDERKNMQFCRKRLDDTQISASHYKITKDIKLFAFGGCFTYDMLAYLEKNKYNVLNKDCYIEPNFIWYNTYTILYEFQRIVKEFVQDPDDIWYTNQGYQDPYRRLVYEQTKEKLWDRINRMNSRMELAIKQSKCLLMTLSLVEVFFQKNGNAICAIPGYGGGGGQDSVFRFVGYDDNYFNIKSMMDILANINPRCHVIFNVSIVPIGRTFVNDDHIVANFEGISILRSVIGKICREYKNAHYFPVYELFLGCPKVNLYQEDGRHVQNTQVEVAMLEFERMFT